MAMMLPLDLIDWYDLHGLHLALSSSAPDNDARMRASANRIAIPRDIKSVFNDDRIATNSLRMLAACHDEREGTSGSRRVSLDHESAVIFGLRRFEYNEQRLGDWSLIKGSPEARQHARALVSVTNAAWRVSTVLKDANIFGSGKDEVWLDCPDLTELTFRRSDNIDPVLRIIDERHELDAAEIERILSAHVLSEGVL